LWVRRKYPQGYLGWNFPVRILPISRMIPQENDLIVVK